MTKAEEYLARLNAPFCWECGTATEVEKDPRYGVRLCSDKCKKAHEMRLDEEARETALAETFGCY
jgi:hypothetical protein